MAAYDDRGASTVVRGRDAIRDHVATVIHSFPDIRFELTRVAHGPDFSCAEWSCAMTHLGDLFGLAPSGRHVTSSGVDVATLDDAGTIVHLVSYYDGAEIMRALGLLPKRRSKAERALTGVASIALRLARRRPR